MTPEGTVVNQEMRPPWKLRLCGGRLDPFDFNLSNEQQLDSSGAAGTGMGSVTETYTV
jgi:hypothetical protein